MQVSDMVSLSAHDRTWQVTGGERLPVGAPGCRPMPAGANPYFNLTEEEAIELTKAEAEENP